MKIYKFNLNGQAQKMNKTELLTFFGNTKRGLKRVNRIIKTNHQGGEVNIYVTKEIDKTEPDVETKNELDIFFDEFEDFTAQSRIGVILKRMQRIENYYRFAC